MRKIHWPGAMLILLALLPMIPSTAVSQSDKGSAVGKKLRSHVEQDVLRKLNPFFPKAKTKLDDKGTLIVLTCARNLGPMMLRKLQPEIENQFYSAGLLAEIGLALTRTKRVGVGFEHEILVFDLSSHKDAWIDGGQISGYVEAYPSICE